MSSRVSRKKANEALDALYRIADTAPSRFDASLVNLLRILIGMDPAKSLIIIREYATHFDELEEPWSVLDLLHSQHKEFIESSSASAFVGTVFWLLKTFEDFRAERADDFTNALLNALHCSDKESIAASYRTLSIYGSEPIELRDGVTGEHLLDPEVSASVLQLLLRKECLVGPSIVQSLTRLAGESEDAFYALMKIALTKRGSAALVDAPVWLVKKNGLAPTQKLKVMLAVMQNRALRVTLAQVPNTAVFLAGLCRIKDVEISKMLSTVARRFVVSEECLAGFGAAKFLSSYMDACVEVGKEQAIEAAVMCLDAFVDCGFVADMPEVVKHVKEFLKRQDKVAGHSVGIAARMARFPECAEVMKSMGFVRYFGKLEKMGSFAKECALFKKNVKSAGE